MYVEAKFVLDMREEEKVKERNSAESGSQLSGLVERAEGSSVSICYTLLGSRHPQT